MTAVDHDLSTRPKPGTYVVTAAPDGAPSFTVRVDKHSMLRSDHLLAMIRSAFVPPGAGTIADKFGGRRSYEKGANVFLFREVSQ